MASLVLLHLVLGLEQEEVRRIQKEILHPLVVVLLALVDHLL